MPTNHYKLNLHAPEPSCLGEHCRSDFLPDPPIPYMKNPHVWIFPFCLYDSKFFGRVLLLIVKAKPLCAIVSIWIEARVGKPTLASIRMQSAEIAVEKTDSGETCPKNSDGKNGKCRVNNIKCGTPAKHSNCFKYSVFRRLGTILSLLGFDFWADFPRISRAITISGPCELRSKPLRKMKLMCAILATMIRDRFLVLRSD